MRGYHIRPCVATFRLTRHRERKAETDKEWGDHFEYSRYLGGDAAGVLLSEPGEALEREGDGVDRFGIT